MDTLIKRVAEIQGDYVVYIYEKGTELGKMGLPGPIVPKLEREKTIGKPILQGWHEGQTIYVFIPPDKPEKYQETEECRVQGDALAYMLNAEKAQELTLVDKTSDKKNILAFVEGIALGNYQFLKYFKNPAEKQNSLKVVNIYSESILDEDLRELRVLAKNTLWARDLVNEPPCHLTAEELAGEFHNKSLELGFKFEAFNKMKIESLRMGGLLAVNRGSKGHPTFSVLEYKPENPVNRHPIVLVGKGIVFDTGGVNIKQVKMEFMKGDMGGAAGVAGAFCAVAEMGLPLHLICLVPATDNRPGENAFVPGDIIPMFDGTQVEVLHTDAEGRLILADALSYAKKYNPALTIDVATLTGSSVRAIGMYGMAAMGNASEETMQQLKECGREVYERVVEFPFWEEYAEEIKSDMADLKNIGSGNASAITAGKFLEHFAPRPWIHLDIAGPSISEHKDSYRGKGGTGYSVRLLYHFLKKQAIKQN